MGRGVSPSLWLVAPCAFYLFIRQPHGSEVSPAARNSLDSAPIPTASKLLICGLFQKGRVLAQDAVAAEPLIAASGARSSWLTRLRNSARNRSRPVPKLGLFEIDHKSAA